MLFDTHVHLDDELFGTQQAAVVQRASQAGVEGLVTVGTTAASSAVCVELAHRFELVFAAVGIQPNYVAQVLSGEWERVVALAQEPKVVALGETGLDRYWDYAPFPLQQDFFDRHLRLSQQLGLPVIIHMRDSAADVLAMLREARSRGVVQGVLHAFSADAATAAEALELGLYVSFAGMVTFPKSQALRDVARAIPPERLLLETDAPYLAPHPRRGQRPNEPALLALTANCLAEVRGVDVATLAGQTTANARRLFGAAGG